VLAGGAKAAGLPRWGLQAGARADLLVLDPRDDALLGIPVGQALDALVFSSPSQAIREVHVAGRCVVRQGRHVGDERLRGRFDAAMQELWPPHG
jgi:formimidoylglutamate deiminase